MKFQQVKFQLPISGQPYASAASTTPPPAPWPERKRLPGADGPPEGENGRAVFPDARSGGLSAISSFSNAKVAPSTVTCDRFSSLVGGARRPIINFAQYFRDI